jgi:hypothetical protein
MTEVNNEFVDFWVLAPCCARMDTNVLQDCATTIFRAEKTKREG